MDDLTFDLPSSLAREFIPEYQYVPHIRAFQHHFMRLLYDPNYNRLVVDVSCRHGKSFQFSQLFPAWYLLTHPGRNVVIVAHTAELAGEFVNWIRSFIKRVGPLVGRTVDPNQQSLSHVRILGGLQSELYGIGRGGAVAGRGAHLLIGDDLLRDQEEAASATIRDATATWWRSEAMLRLEPGAKVVICMSRRHPDDLSGFCLSQNPLLDPQDQWHHVRFPAISETGEALWPARYPLDKLRRIQQEYEQTGHGYIFDSLYLQNPAADPTAIDFPRSYFENIWYTDLPEQPYFRYGALDPAQGKSDTGDYSCAVSLLVDSQDNYYVDDALLLRTPIPEFEALAAEFFSRQPHDAILCESNIESGLSYHIAELAQERYGAELCMNSIHHTEPKETRLRKHLSGPLCAHKIKFRDTPIMRAGVKQISELFSGRYFDFPDALAMALELQKAHYAQSALQVQ